MFDYNGVKINYKDYGNKDKEAIVYLHGWGQNIEMMEPIAKPFVETNRVIILDLPGFGASDKPTYTWSIEEYADMLNSLLTKLKIKEPNIIGHSFGGKIAICYASKYKTKRLILLASPYKVKYRKQPLKVRIYKKIKKIPFLNGLSEILKKHIGSRDYRNADPVMRDILVKHVNTDFTDNVLKIKCPTLLIWGTNDQEVSIDCAYELERLIDNCGVVVYEGCSHYAYLERLNQTISVLKSFIK